MKKIILKKTMILLLSCNCFAGEKEKMEQHQELMKLSTIIDSIKVEVGQLAEMVEKQEQYLDDLEQYGRSNCFILHGNNIDHRISSMDVEEYVLNILNTRLNLSTTVSDSDIDICFVFFLFIYLFESDTRSIEKRKNTHNNNNKKRKQAGKKNRTFELHQQLKTMFIIVTLVEEIAIHRIVNIHITRKATPFYKSINKFSL